MEFGWREFSVGQQDYLWFLSGLGHGVALAVWYRAARRESAVGWLPWVSAGSIFHAAVELALLYFWPVRPEPNETPFLGPDLAYGALLALQVLGLSWPRYRGRRAAQVGWPIVAVALAAARHWFPVPATLLLALWATWALLVWDGDFRRFAEGFWLRIAAIAAVWLSPIGPVIAATSGLRRVNQLGVWGLWSSIAPAIVAFGAIWLLIRVRRDAVERREWGRYARLSGVWLAAGLLLAAMLGERSRDQFEASAIARAAAAARLMDRPMLEAALAEFAPAGRRPHAQPDGSSIVVASVSAGFQQRIAPVRRQLGVIEQANPDAMIAMLVVVRGDEVFVIAVPDGRRAKADVVRVKAKRVPTEFADPVAGATGVFVRPHQIGTAGEGEARAPIPGEDGSPVAWLTLRFPSATWSVSQVQSRVLAFVILAMGLGLAARSVTLRLEAIRSDDARRDAAAARIADRAKSEFLARVSHELRTPIQSVLGYGEMLGRTHLDPASHAWLSALRQHGELMLRLVNDLLDLGAMQTAGFRLAPRAIRVVPLIEQTVESLRPRAEAKGLAFEFKNSLPVDDWRWADGERLRQIALNVVGNAIKFTDDGHVAVQLAAGADEMILLTVCDTGPGVPAGCEERIMRPFVRLEQTASKEGSGLGLALTAALCGQMDGRISAGRARAGGAEFTVEIRLKRCDPPERSWENPASPGLAGLRVLVVDDNTLIRELFSAFLTGSGVSCDAVSSGEAAVERIGVGMHDVVLLDLAMPGMDGMETARRIRIRCGTRIRIIGISAHATAVDREAALQAGMNEFLTKPVDLGLLARTLARAALPPASDDVSLADPVFGRLMELFRFELPGLADALREAEAEKNWPLLRAKAHYLKNGADVLQLHDLATACAALETVARDQNEPQLGEAARACRTALREWL